MIEPRPLTDADMPMLAAWLRRPHVLRWWNDGHDTLEKVRAFYGAPGPGERYFVLEEDGSPVAYGQALGLDRAEIGLDLFVADDADRGRGLGGRCLLALMEHVDAAAYSVDPHPDNRAAIRAYAKAGFVRIEERSGPTVCFMRRAWP